MLHFIKWQKFLLGIYELNVKSRRIYDWFCRSKGKNCQLQIFRSGIVSVEYRGFLGHKRMVIIYNREYPALYNWPIRGQYCAKSANKKAGLLGANPFNGKAAVRKQLSIIVLYLVSGWPGLGNQDTLIQFQFSKLTNIRRGEETKSEMGSHNVGEQAPFRMGKGLGIITVQSCQTLVQEVLMKDSRINRKAFSSKTLASLIFFCVLAVQNYILGLTFP